MTVLEAAEKVVLLHGLARTSKSMHTLEATLQQEGYVVLNMDYPSRKHTIQRLSSIVKGYIDSQSTEEDTLHVVTHSMGGIILRYLQLHDPIDNLGRVVMLSPPNKGSEVVDKLGDLTVFEWINGPAGSQLGTEPDGFVRSLGDVDFELGIITGDRSINLVLSMLIPGKDDGKVSVESAKVSGMKAFKVIHATHPFIMKKACVQRDVISFLRNGIFHAGDA